MSNGNASLVLPHLPIVFLGVREYLSDHGTSGLDNHGNYLAMGRKYVSWTLYSAESKQGQCIRVAAVATIASDKSGACHRTK